MVDQRKVVGTAIVAKATHVLNDVEASRRYGRLKDTKMLTGEVREVLNPINPKTGKRSCMIVGAYNVGGDNIKLKQLNIRSVQLAPPPEPAAVLLPAVDDVAPI